MFLISVDGTSTIIKLPKQQISSLIRIFRSPVHKYNGIATLLNIHNFKNIHRVSIIKMSNKIWVFPISFNVFSELHNIKLLQKYFWCPYFVAASLSPE